MYPNEYATLTTAVFAGLLFTFGAMGNFWGTRGRPGDEVLRSLAQAMQQSLYRPNDFLARYGGEEFCAVLSETDSEAAVQVAERLSL